MDNNEILLRQLEGFELRVNARFDKVEVKFDALDARTDKVERDLLIGKTASAVVTTLASVVGAAFNWDHVKPWLISLMR
jgi:hypothetical protein